VRFYVIAVLFFAIIAQAGEPADAVLERLAKVEQFAFGPTGYAGVISRGEKDYRLILSRPSALADLERLYSVGNMQAKSYALLGIRRLNPRRFKELSSAIRDSKDEVITQSGCIVSHESFGVIVGRIEGGKYAGE
jgi:hypothetical protein